MTEIGRVTKIDGKRVTVLCKPSTACHSCGGGSCGAKDRELTVENTRELPLSEGDYTEVYISSSQAVRSGFQVLVFPLVLFFAFYMAAQKGLGITREGPLVLSGLVGMVAGFFGVYVLSRKNQKLPEIVRLLTEEDVKTAAAESEEPADFTA
jgi:positive regulator of sigma E activity